MVAPADLDIMRQSNKYRDLRQELLDALTKNAWGVKITLKADTLDELKRETKKFIQAAATWGRSIKLSQRHGLTLKTRVISDPDAIQTTIKLYFEQIPANSSVAQQHGE